MLLLDSKQWDIDGITVFPDHADPQQIALPADDAASRPRSGTLRPRATWRCRNSR